MIEASCHCGAVRLQIAAAPAQITDCNCSICRRLGARWAYYPPDDVTIIAAPRATAAYAWGEKAIAFHHCRTCGCPTHWRGLYETRYDRMGVNARLFDPAVLKGVAVRKLDGAETWKSRIEPGE
jgi:hypothetical protein